MSEPFDNIVIWHRTLPPSRPAEDRAELSIDWLRLVRKRAEDAGGRVLAQVGGAIVITFEALDVRDALNFSLALLDVALERDDPPGGMRIALGAAVGPLEEHDIHCSGSTIDRAQLLANRARRNEVVLDTAARDCVSDVFLFGRSVGTGTSALRGYAIDRRVPRRAYCRKWVQELNPAPVPSITAESLAEVRTLAARTRGNDNVILRGPRGNGGATFVYQLAEEQQPPLILHFAGVPGGLEPLGSLRLALSRQWGSGSRLESAVGTEAPSLVRVARGQPVEKGVLYREMTALIGHHAASGKRPWFVFNPLAHIDVTTLGLVHGLARNSDLFLVARMLVGSSPPGPFGSMKWQDFTLPPLRSEDAREIARVVLGVHTEDDVVRRVASLGGETMLGVVETARTLVSAGDLIYSKPRFVWRNGPRMARGAISMSRVLGERIATLEPMAMRMLEAICISPPGTPRLLGASIAERDGLDAELRRDATRRLAQEGFLAGGSQLQPSSEALRTAVLARIPSARSAELHRFVAEAMSASSLFPGVLPRATQGYFLARGGSPKEAALATLEAAHGALEGKMNQAARRLAASAVQLYPQAEIREAAAAIAKLAHVTVERQERSTSARIVEGLLGGRFDEVDEQIDAAIAEGKDLAAAHRARTLVALGRGDTTAAFSAFEHARSKSGADLGAQARTSLTLAWLLLHDGDGESCLRACLGALAAARRVKDPRGEAAAMHTLAAAFRAMGREQDAMRVAEAAPA